MVTYFKVFNHEHDLLIFMLYSLKQNDFILLEVSVTWFRKPVYSSHLPVVLDDVVLKFDLHMSQTKSKPHSCVCFMFSVIKVI